MKPVIQKLSLLVLTCLLQPTFAGESSNTLITEVTIGHHQIRTIRLVKSINSSKEQSKITLLVDGSVTAERVISKKLEKELSTRLNRIFADKIIAGLNDPRPCGERFEVLKTDEKQSSTSVDIICLDFASPAVRADALNWWTMALSTTKPRKD